MATLSNGRETISVKRRNLECVQAEAIIDITSQGTTLPAVIADITIPPDGHFKMQNIYIPLSRVKFQDDAAILQDFTRATLDKLRLNSDLLFDVERLQGEADTTISDAPFDLGLARNLATSHRYSNEERLDALRQAVEADGKKPRAH